MTKEFPVRGTPSLVGRCSLVGLFFVIGVVKDLVQKGHDVTWIDGHWHAPVTFETDQLFFLSKPQDFESPILF